MLPRTNLITCLVFLQFQEILINAWPTLQVTVLNDTITYAAEYVKYSMVPSNVSAGAYDVHLNVLRENLMPIVKLGIYFENVEFMNKTINVCKVANSKNDEPLLKLIVKVIASNEARLPKKCPVKKGKYYNFLKRIETDKIPPVWPEKIVSFHINVYASESDRLIPVLSQVIFCQFSKRRSR